MFTMNSKPCFTFIRDGDRTVLLSVEGEGFEDCPERFRVFWSQLSRSAENIIKDLDHIEDEAIKIMALNIDQEAKKSVSELMFKLRERERQRDRKMDTQ